MEIINKNKVPQQQEGSSSETSASYSCNTIEDAKGFYKTVKSRLLKINDWEKIAGIGSADFVLCDSSGEPIRRAPQKDDHIRIDIPGPGPVTGDGYDWVQIESILENNNESADNITITVRPATNPLNDRKDVAHFFTDAATSSFIAERRDNIVTAAVIGRNEKPNVEAEKKVDSVRNTSVAAVAVTVFSKIQWKGLVNGLIKEY